MKHYKQQIYEYESIRDQEKYLNRSLHEDRISSSDWYHYMEKLEVKWEEYISKWYKRDSSKET